MFLNSQPQHTKQTRTNNNLPNTNSIDNFLRPASSQISTPIIYNHDSYMIDHNSRVMHSIDIERNFLNTRHSGSDTSRKTEQVQSLFQNDYYTKNFNINNTENKNIDLNDEFQLNPYLTRNPVNTRRDQMEKSRNVERQSFIKTQGGVLNNYADFSLQTTRKDKNTINSSSYTPMPKTLAIPKENI
jgi:hypothetical protein